MELLLSARRRRWGLGRCRGALKAREQRDDLLKKSAVRFVQISLFSLVYHREDCEKTARISLVMGVEVLCENRSVSE